MFLHQKLPKKVNFSSNCDYNTGTLLTFIPKKWFFPQNAPAYRALFWLFCLIMQCVFTPKIPKKLIFPQIVTIVQGTLLTFIPKKVIFSSKCASILSTILIFCPIIQCVFTPQIPKKLIFPQIATIMQGTLLIFLL